MIKHITKINTKVILKMKIWKNPPEYITYKMKCLHSGLYLDTFDFAK